MLKAAVTALMDPFVQIVTIRTRAVSQRRVDEMCRVE